MITARPRTTVTRTLLSVLTAALSCFMGIAPAHSDDPAEDAAIAAFVRLGG